MHLKMAQTTAGDSTQGRQLTSSRDHQNDPIIKGRPTRPSGSISGYLQAFRGIVAFAICISRMSAV